MNRLKETNSEALIRRIAKEHRTQEGGFDWSGAFAAHPEWEQQLGWSNPTKRQRAYNRASLMKKERATQATVKPPPSRSSNGQANGGMSQREIIAEIGGKYRRPTDGKVIWGQVWADHPEWKEILGVRGPKDMPRLYGAIRFINQKDGRVRRWQSKPAPTNGEQAPIQQRQFEPIHFCPGCGLNLRMFHAALQVALKHSNK